MRSIDLNCPDFVIELSSLGSASEICSIMKNLGIEDYAYAFKYRNNFLKIGMSGKMSLVYGERIYRQAANIPGWPQTMLGSSGKDIIPVLEIFEQQHQVKVTRIDCTIEIWDTTNEPKVATGNPTYNAKLAEDTLLDQYENLHECLPVGNFKDTRPRGSKGYVSSTLLANLFGEVF